MRNADDRARKAFTTAPGTAPTASKAASGRSDTTAAPMGDSSPAWAAATPKPMPPMSAMPPASRCRAEPRALGRAARSTARSKSASAARSSAAARSAVPHTRCSVPCSIAASAATATAAWALAPASAASRASRHDSAAEPKPATTRQISSTAPAAGSTARLIAAAGAVLPICLLVAGFGAAVNGWMSPADLESWGWRLPFALGLVIGPVGWYIRRHTEEPREFAQVLARRREQGAEAAASPWSAVRRYPRETLAGFCITILWTVGTYFFLVYMPTYAVRELHLPATERKS